MGTFKELTSVPAFDEIVFESRNKEYGAYVLRKNYSRHVSFALIVAVTLAFLSIIIPYMKMKSKGAGEGRTERQIASIVMTNIDQDVEQLRLPETPPPPADVVQQAKYVPPVIVDSVKPEDAFLLLTADEAEEAVKNEDVIDIPVEVKPEIQEEETEPEPFVKVEEDPSFPGGETELLKFVYDHVQYPEVARENNIQGKVIVKFCVTSTGGVNQISILKSVDPEIDKEVTRVISILPPFKPGKQGGKPVPVWYILPVSFKLNPI
ncbi:MAG TPA: energy transducer TonB [Bacteroidales bacterium]|nr:energy transducer TonB [Bacteroidales bacterium]